MKRAILICVLLAAVLGLNAAARKPKALKRPAWVDDPAREYREDRWLSAVGTGASKAEAETQAVAKLAAIIHGEADPYGLVIADTAPLDQELVLIQTGKAWKDERSIWYTLVGLDRAASSALHQQRLADNNALVMNHLKAVLQISNPWHAYARLSAAGKIDGQSNALLDQLAVISPKARSAYNAAYDTEVLSYQIADAARKLQFRFDFAGVEAQSLRPSLEAVLSEQGFAPDPLGENVIGGQLSLVSSRDLNTVSYVLSVSVADTDQKVIISFSDEGSATGSTEAEARANALRAVNSKLETEFRKALTDYIASLAGL